MLSRRASELVLCVLAVGVVGGCRMASTPFARLSAQPPAPRSPLASAHRSNVAAPRTASVPRAATNRMLDFESEPTQDVRVASHDVITGRVVDASGRPQPNVTVVGTATSRATSQRKQAVTDSTGVFRLDGLQSGERYLILATAMRSSVPLIGRVSATAPEQQVVIQVSRPFTAQRIRANPSVLESWDEGLSRAGVDARGRDGRPRGGSLPDLRREQTEAAQRELPWDMPPAPGTGKPAWFKKGSGTVVRSTLRAVPATVPDPFLNHAGKPLWVPADDRHSLRNEQPTDAEIAAADQLASRTPDASHSLVRGGHAAAAVDSPPDDCVNPRQPLSWPDDTAADAANPERDWKSAALRPTAPSPSRAYQATTCQFDGNRLVDFQLPDLELREVTFRELPGRLVLLDFWGSWCGYCLKTMPHLVELQRRYGAQGLQVVGIAYEQGRLSDRVERVREIREQLAVNYPLLVADGGAACPVREKFGIQLYPTLVLVDRSGRVLWRSEGSEPRDLDRLENLLKTQLADVTKSL